MAFAVMQHNKQIPHTDIFNNDRANATRVFEVDIKSKGKGAITANGPA
jgi:hypothetical protein